MNVLEEFPVHCPYCGERVVLLADISAGRQQYIEDCEVCCRPMTVTADFGESRSATVDVRSESDCS